MKDNYKVKQMSHLTDGTNDQAIKRVSRKPSHRKTNSSIFLNGNYLFQPSDSNPTINQPPFSTTNIQNDNELLDRGLSNKMNSEVEYNNLNDSSDNNNSHNSSVIIKGDESTTQAKTIIDPFVKQKSFVSLINTLAYAQDKETNATESYLLALGLCNNKKKYNATSTSAIEEENTVLVTESNFSIKKSMKKSLTIDSKEFPSKNLNHQFEEKKDELKISLLAKTIRELIQKKIEKENQLKRKLETNKKTLLSSFYSIANEQYIKCNNSNTERASNTKFVIENAGQLKVLPAKKHNPSLSILTSKLRLNKSNVNNANISKSIIPYNSKPNAKIKKKSKCIIETDYNVSSLNWNNFSNAVTVIKSKPKRVNTSVNTNSNSITMGTRANSHLSKGNKQRNISWNISPMNGSIFSAIKGQGGIREQGQGQGQGQEKEKCDYNNKAIAVTLSHLTYTKSYEEQDVLEKAQLSKKGCYLILCKPRNTFIGLFKYFQDKHKFIKVYGSELCQNTIFPEKILSVGIDDGNRNYELSNDIVYNDNKSMVIFKNGNEFIGLINE